MTEYIICTYCGADSEIVREHVIPVIYLSSRSYDSDRQWIVSACKHCNILAGSKVFFSIPEKAAYILQRYKKRYRKMLAIPVWSEQELKEMGYLLRKSIEGGIVAKSILGQRIKHLEVISTYARDYNRPKWVEREYQKWLEAQTMPRKKKRKKKYLNQKTT